VTADRYEMMLTASHVLLVVAAFLGSLGGFGKWYFDKKLQEAKRAASYEYFRGPYAFDPGAVHPSSRPLLNELDLAKRRADETLSQELRQQAPIERLRVVNDYTFKLFRQMRFVQEKWFNANGRFFQGKATMPSPPSVLTDGRVALESGLTDQVDDWRDVGYVDQSAPVQLRADVYEGPQGHGYIVTAKMLVGRQVWLNQMHVGPEQRNVQQYVWRPE
jgi:hypothetical protein